MSTEAERTSEETKPLWQPLGAVDRRVAGVLIEKAKTTPDAYPLTLNAIRTGCNQKSNRSPTMDLSAEDIEDSLDRLREVGGVSCIQGVGRVDKYRHEMYRWLGVEKIELAVMGELLLRGAQSEGELRGRAARMDPIPDVSALRPILAALKAKSLILSLTGEGRGHVVTHALYRPGELEKLKAQFGQPTQPGPQEPGRDVATAPDSPDVEVAQPRTRTETSRIETPSRELDTISRSEFESLRQEFEKSRAEIQQLRADLEDLRTEYGQSVDDLYRLKEALGG